MTTPQRPSLLRRMRPGDGRRKRQRRQAGSKMVTDRIKDTRDLVAAIKGFKAEAAAGLAERMTPVLRDGESVPDHALSLELAGRSLELALDELLEAEDRYQRLRADYYLLRKACERFARREVNPPTVDVRRSIDSVFGKLEGRRLHGIEGRVRRKPLRLRFQLDSMMLRLRDRSAPLPEPRAAGFRGDRDVWRRQIEPLYKELVRRTDELESVKIDRDDRRLERQRAMDRFDRVLGETLQYAAAVFAMAGCHPKKIEVLRSYHKRRQLRREARLKREARKAKRGRAPAQRPAATAAPRGIRAAISGWFRKSA